MTDLPATVAASATGNAESTGFEQNLERVPQLILLFERMAPENGRRPPHSSDILRAAVVLLHATQEEFLRETALRILPYGSPSRLEGIPLRGMGRSDARFGLHDLARARGESIEDVIVDSVEKHLSRRTFNSVASVRDLVTQTGVPWQAIDVDWPQLGTLMSRRHQIVHLGDRRTQDSGRSGRLQPLASETVRRWVGCVRTLHREVTARLEGSV